jgi:hypothetical protein
MSALIPTSFDPLSSKTIYEPDAAPSSDHKTVYLIGMFALRSTLTLLSFVLLGSTALALPIS